MFPLLEQVLWRVNDAVDFVGNRNPRGRFQCEDELLGEHSGA